MNIKKLFITIILILIPSTVSSTQASILEALRAGIPPIIVASEIDKLIQDEPNCSTANFLRSILQNYPNNKPIIYRIARRFHQLNCEEHADALKHTLLQQAEQLSIIQSVNKLLNSLTDKKAIPTFVLQVQEGFYLKTGGLFRAALSPSKRYLSVSQIEEKGAIKIWDLKTGYFVSSLSENFTIISTFINDRYLLLASQIGIQVWDIIENKKELLSINLVSIPSFLERSSDGKHIAINNLKGEVTIYEINAHAPFKLKRKQIVSIAQVAKFVDNKTLLLGNEGGKFCLYDIELSSTGCDFSVKTSEHFELEIMRTLKVRSQIAVSEDGQRYAILINKQLALVERHNGQLKLIKTLKKPEPIHAAVFTAKHLVVLTDSQLLYFNFEGELLANSPIKNAKWMQKVGESSVVLIGDDFLSIYDLERRTVLSQHIANINSLFKANTRLIDANHLLFYTPKNGLRRVNLRDAMKGVELLYRGSSDHLFYLDKYQDTLYWIEQNYFYYLRQKKIRFVKMPDSVSKDKLTKSLIAFNGEELAFISHGKVKLFSVNDYQIRDLSNLNDVIKLAYHPKNKQWLLIARQGGEIELWDIQQQELKKRYVTQRHNITQLAFAPNGEYLAILSSHHIDIWELSPNQIRFSKQLQTLGFFKSVFDSSLLKKLEGIALFRIAFDSKSTRHPNFIQAILQCQKPTVAATPPPVPPQVEILSPQISPLSSQEIKQTSLAFKLRLSGKQVVESIAVIVNGTKRQTWKVNSKDKEIEVLVDSLQSGYNHISFIATDVQRNTSFPFGYTVYVTAESKNLPDLYFLGIGANSTDLKYPYKDAELLASQFAKMEKGKYWNKIHTQVLKRSQITQKGIKKALRRLSSKLTANDLLIIYLSGHGKRAANGEPFFVTNQGQLSWKKLAKWLGKIKARTLVLLDACRAGDVDNQSLVADLIAERDTGILVFSAARSWQNTYEWDGMGNSLFAKVISNAFDEEVDINQDGVISLSEFYHFTTTQVERISRDFFNKGMEKQKSSILEGIFKPGFDSKFHKLIRVPHTPWLPNMELFGDIPLITTKP